MCLVEIGLGVSFKLEGYIYVGYIQSGCECVLGVSDSFICVYICVCTFIYDEFVLVSMYIWYYRSMVCVFSTFTCWVGCVILVGSRSVSSRLYIWLSE